VLFLEKEDKTDLDVELEGFSSEQPDGHIAPGRWQVAVIGQRRGRAGKSRGRAGRRSASFGVRDGDRAGG